MKSTGEPVSAVCKTIAALEDQMDKKLSRRDFLRLTAGAGAGAISGTSQT